MFVIQNSRQSIIESIFDLLSDFVLFLQILLECLDLLGQQVVNLQLPPYNHFKLVHVSIDIVVNEADTLHRRNKLTLHVQQFSILLYGCHMGCKYLLLFLQNIADFFMEVEKFLLLVVLHGFLHDSHIVTCLVLIVPYQFRFDVLLDFLLVFLLLSRLIFHFLTHALIDSLSFIQ